MVEGKFTVGVRGNHDDIGLDEVRKVGCLCCLPASLSRELRKAGESLAWSWSSGHPVHRRAVVQRGLAEAGSGTGQRPAEK